MATGVAAGIYDWSIAAERAQVVATVEPTTEGVALYAELATIYEDAYGALAPIYERLTRITGAENRSANW